MCPRHSVRGAGIDDHDPRRPGQQIGGQIRRIGTKLQLGLEKALASAAPATPVLNT